MQPRVIAILAARNGAGYLERTIAALARLTRQPDVLIAVDAGSTDTSSRLLAAIDPSQFVSAPHQRSFGSVVAHAVQVAAPEPDDNDWLWLLGHDNAPEPRALAELLRAVEIAPSVAVAGPKLMRWDNPGVIAEFGQTTTRWGASIALVQDELDQAQHDVQHDVLGVSAAGMLVRRSVWSALGGFDPALSGIDAALDFSIRARLAGHRVVTVPGARVATAGESEWFAQHSPPGLAGHARLARAAQLHRRMVYAPFWALPAHWLSLLPLGVIRALGHLVAKRPGLVAGEFITALSTAANLRTVAAARRNLRRTSRLGWGAISPLRLPWAEARERRAHAREAALASETGSDGTSSEPEVVGFFSGGGLWVTLAVALVSLISFGPLLGAPAIVGGGLLPLSPSIADLWGHLGYGWRDIGIGFVGAADPFSYLLAVAGTLTFWSPSFSIMLLYLLAMPLAALAGWFCARRLSRHGWLPGVVAILWAFAPPFLSALTAGRFGAVLVHLLLPWLVLACLGATRTHRSWSATATAALLFAAVAAAAPILLPALLLVWLGWLAVRPKALPRLLLLPVPAVVLFAPLVIEQFLRGNPLGVLADPGLPSVYKAAPGWQLALASPAAGLNGWSGALGFLGLAGLPAPVVLAVLLAPLGVLALLALFLPGSRRAVVPLTVALLGFATAVAASHLHLTAVGSQPTPVWAGSGLSLFWLGLLAAAVITFDSLAATAVPVAVLVGTATCLSAVPLLAAILTGGTGVQASSGRIVPAVVSAQADTHPDIGTLFLSAQPNGSLAATVQRGHGTTLDAQSTLQSTARRLGPGERSLATLVGNLASSDGYDASTQLNRFSIGFIVLNRGSGAYPSDPGTVVYRRASEALDSNALFTPLGGTTKSGLLWRAQAMPQRTAVHPVGNTETPLGVAVLSTQAAVFGITGLLAIPTERRRRRIITKTADIDEPMGTFDEDDRV